MNPRISITPSDVAPNFYHVSYNDKLVGTVLLKKNKTSWGYSNSKSGPWFWGYRDFYQAVRALLKTLGLKEARQKKKVLYPKKLGPVEYDHPDKKDPTMEGTQTSSAPSLPATFIPSDYGYPPYPATPVIASVRGFTKTAQQYRLEPITSKTENPAYSVIIDNRVIGWVDFRPKHNSWFYSPIGGLERAYGPFSTSDEAVQDLMVRFKMQRKANIKGLTKDARLLTTAKEDGEESWEFEADDIEIKPFYIERLEDESGISGTGKVAYGLVLPSGRAVIEWTTGHPSITIFNSIDELLAVHGHGGKTQVKYLKHTESSVIKRLIRVAQINGTMYEVWANKDSLYTRTDSRLEATALLQRLKSQGNKDAFISQRKEAQVQQRVRPSATPKYEEIKAKVAKTNSIDQLYDIYNELDKQSQRDLFEDVFFQRLSNLIWKNYPKAPRLLNEQDFYNFYGASHLVGFLDTARSGAVRIILDTIESFSRKLVAAAKHAVGLEMTGVIAALGLPKSDYGNIDSFVAQMAAQKIPFERLARLFDKAPGPYGGGPWVEIANEALKLEKMLPVNQSNATEVIAQTDHVVDLEHNNGLFLEQYVPDTLKDGEIYSFLDQKSQEWDWDFFREKAPQFYNMYQQLKRYAKIKGFVKEAQVQPGSLITVPQPGSLIGTPQIEIDPTIAAEIGDAVEQLRATDPNYFKDVSKIIALHGGPYGQVSSEDPSIIHLNVQKIQSEVKSKLGSFDSNNPEHREAFEEAIKHALVEVITHEKGHVSDWDPEHRQFPGGEGAAEREVHVMMPRVFHSSIKGLCKTAQSTDTEEEITEDTEVSGSQQKIINNSFEELKKFIDTQTEECLEGKLVELPYLDIEKAKKRLSDKEKGEIEEYLKGKVTEIQKNRSKVVKEFFEIYNTGLDSWIAALEYLKNHKQGEVILDYMIRDSSTIEEAIKDYDGTNLFDLPISVQQEVDIFPKDFYDFYMASLITLHLFDSVKLPTAWKNAAAPKVAAAINDMASKVCEAARIACCSELLHLPMTIGAEETAIDTRLEILRELKKTYGSIGKFVKMCNEVKLPWSDIIYWISRPTWSEGYGGQAWATIATLSQQLEEALPATAESLSDIILQTDHVIDLEHNSALFLRDFSHVGSGVTLKDFLTQKTNDWTIEFLAEKSPGLGRIYKNLKRYASFRGFTKTASLPHDAKWSSPDRGFSRIWMLSSTGNRAFWKVHGEWREIEGNAWNVGNNMAPNSRSVKEVRQEFFGEEPWSIESSTKGFCKTAQENRTIVHEGPLVMPLIHKKIPPTRMEVTMDILHSIISEGNEDELEQFFYTLSPATQKLALDEIAKYHPLWQTSALYKRLSKSAQQHKTVIGIDIDGVIANTHDILMDIASEFVPVDEEDRKQYRVEDVKHGYPELRGQVFEKIYERKAVADAPVMPHAVEKINEIFDAGHKVVLITARPKNWEEQTREWLKKIGLKHHTLIFCSNEAKGKRAKEEGVQVFIEDKPENLESIAEQGIRVYAFEQPWNKDVDVPHITDWRNVRAQVVPQRKEETPEEREKALERQREATRKYREKIKQDPEKWKEYVEKHNERQFQRIEKIKQDPEKWKEYRKRKKERRRKQIEKIKQDPKKWEEFLEKHRERLREDREKIKQDPEKWKEQNRKVLERLRERMQNEEGYREHFNRKKKEWLERKKKEDPEWYQERDRQHKEWSHQYYRENPDYRQRMKDKYVRWKDYYVPPTKGETPEARNVRITEMWDRFLRGEQDPTFLEQHEAYERWLQERRKERGLQPGESAKVSWQEYLEWSNPLYRPQVDWESEKSQKQEGQIQGFTKFSAPRWTTEEKNRLKELYIKYRERKYPHHIIYKAVAHLLNKSWVAVKQKLETMYDIDNDLKPMKYEHWDKGRIDQMLQELYRGGQDINRLGLPATLMYQITNHSMPKAQTCGFPTYYDSFDEGMASNILAVGFEREGDKLTDKPIKTLEDALKYYRRQEKLAHAWTKNEIVALFREAHVAGLPLTCSFFKSHPDIYRPLLGVGRSLEGLKDSVKRNGYSWSDLVVEAAPEYADLYNDEGKLRSSTEELRIRRFLEINNIPFKVATLQDKISISDPVLRELGYKHFVPDFFILDQRGSIQGVVEVFGSIADSMASNTSEIYREKKQAKENFYKTLPYRFVAINNNSDGVDLSDEALQEKFSYFLQG